MPRTMFGALVLWTALSASLHSLHSLHAQSSRQGGDNEIYSAARGLMSVDAKERKKAAKSLQRAKDPGVVFPIVDALFYIPRENRSEAIEALVKLTGRNRGTKYLPWVELAGSMTELEPPPGYLEWKRSLLARIDARYRQVLFDDVPARIALQEIVWGGVTLDGIPVWESPPKVPREEAGFLDDSDRVLGVSVGGVHHAYPVKVASWHEMIHDTVGGEPVLLSYCTLCGSAILYSAERADGSVLRFGTSGLLYRSNKLMFDRDSHSLWLNLTGEAVLGRAAASEEKLELLPVTLTTWKSWRTRYPESTVAQPDPALGAKYGFVYEEGAADRARSGVDFPVWQKSERMEPKAEVLALELGGKTKAYSVEALLDAGVVNDRLGEVDLVVIAQREGREVRAYQRGDRQFRWSDGRLVDQDQRIYAISEQSLRPEDDGTEPWARIPGHVAFWFGWYGVHPDTEVYPPG